MLADLGLNNDGLPPNRNYADAAMDLAAAGYLCLARGVAPFAGVALHKAALHLCSRKNSSRACARQGGFAISRASITMHGTALAAVLILIVLVWLAPSHKKVVTWGGVYRGLRRCALPGLAHRGLG